MNYLLFLSFIAFLTIPVLGMEKENEQTRGKKRSFQELTLELGYDPETPLVSELPKTPATAVQSHQYSNFDAETPLVKDLENYSSESNESDDETIVDNSVLLKCPQCNNTY